MVVNVYQYKLNVKRSKKMYITCKKKLRKNICFVNLVKSVIVYAKQVKFLYIQNWSLFSLSVFFYLISDIFKKLSLFESGIWPSPS